MPLVRDKIRQTEELGLIKKMTETAIILGVGTANGTGAAIARKFAEEGKHVIICGRHRERLAVISNDIVAGGFSAEPYVVDLTNPSDQNELFDYAKSKTPVAAVVYNAGNNNYVPFEQLDEKTFEAYWRVGCLGGFLSAKRAIPILKEQGWGSLFFTGASASLRGKPGFAQFAASKGGLRNLAQALAREFGPHGIHVAHVLIDGVIDTEDTRTRFGGYVEQLGESGALSPASIADAFWYVHNQPKSCWTHEIDLRPFSEKW